MNRAVTLFAVEMSSAVNSSWIALFQASAATTPNAVETSATTVARNSRENRLAFFTTASTGPGSSLGASGSMGVSSVKRFLLSSGARGRGRGSDASRCSGLTGSVCLFRLPRGRSKGGRGTMASRTSTQAGSGLDRYFKISERGSTVRTEVVAGLATWLTMAYILFVNPGILTSLPDHTGLTLPFNQVVTV